MSDLRSHHKGYKRVFPTPFGRKCVKKKKKGPGIHSNKNRPFFWKVKHSKAREAQRAWLVWFSVESQPRNQKGHQFHFQSGTCPGCRLHVK